MNRIRFSPTVPIPVLILALACQSGTGPFGLLASSSQYTIVYSDSGSQPYASSSGGFSSFLDQQGAAEGRWTAVYLVGDSVRITQLLSIGTQCPSPLTVPITTDSLAVDSASVLVRHKRIRNTAPDPVISSLTIDSVASGWVWGRFSISLHQVVPEFGGPNATLTGEFRLFEVEYLSRMPHCSGAA